MDVIMKKYEYDKLTVTAQAYDRKVSVEYPQDLDMMELLDDVFVFRRHMESLCHCVG
jgi:hypothetical protein